MPGSTINNKGEVAAIHGRSLQSTEKGEGRSLQHSAQSKIKDEGSTPEMENQKIETDRDDQFIRRQRYDAKKSISQGAGLTKGDA